MVHNRSHTTFPFTPQPPTWQLDWEGLQAQFTCIQALRGVMQEPLYHTEGDVYTHTRMVVEALSSNAEWRNLADEDRSLLFAATLLHDVGKPACTRIEEDGHISSRGHARKGELMVRRLLLTGEDLPAPLPGIQREYIARLVRLHGLPLQFLDKPDPVRTIITASQSVRMDHLALLAEADVRGRICEDQQELLTRIALFREFCQEQACYSQPYAFATPHSRFVYVHSEQADPTYAAYDTTKFEVVLMSGLPGSGKDTWIQTHLPDLPVISLDAIRQELKISPTAEQGRVVQLARERAREFLRQQQPFVWNATNISKMLRQQLVDLFVAYDARVRIVYLEVPLDVLLQRNHTRSAGLPEQAISKMLDKLEPPDITEAHEVTWIWGDAV